MKSVTFYFYFFNTKSLECRSDQQEIVVNDEQSKPDVLLGSFRVTQLSYKNASSLAQSDFRVFTILEEGWKVVASCIIELFKIEFHL